MAFAKGQKAIAICDRCGLQYKRLLLKPQYLAGRNTGLLVCQECLDPDNPRDRPQPWLRKIEGIAIQQPRPDGQLAIERGPYGFNPLQGVLVEVFPPRYMDQLTLTKDLY